MAGQRSCPWLVLAQMSKLSRKYPALPLSGRRRPRYQASIHVTAARIRRRPDESAAHCWNRSFTCKMSKATLCISSQSRCGLSRSSYSMGQSQHYSDFPLHGVFSVSCSPSSEFFKIAAFLKLFDAGKGNRSMVNVTDPCASIQ